MISGMYCLFDKVACEYLPIFEARNDSVAVQQVKIAFEGNKLSPMSISDIQLYKLGTVKRSDDDNTSIEVRIDPLKYVDIRHEVINDECV